MLNTTLENDLYDRYLQFPALSYEEYQSLPDDLRMEIVTKNRMVQTDTYNRTMDHIKRDDWSVEETYLLQFRASPEGYLIVCGIRDRLRRLLKLPITQVELDFADEFYRDHANVKFFNKKMWQDVIDNHGGRIPLEIDALPEGTAVLPGDPVLKVRGQGEMAAFFEPEFHRIFYESLVAAAAHEIATKIGANRFIEVGKRGTPEEIQHLRALKAMLYSGLFLTSNDAGSACFPEAKDVGTLGHRFIQFYETEDEAFRKAVEETDNVSLLIDLVDSYKGIDKAIALKNEFRDSGKKIWIRLDSGDIKKQAAYVLWRFAEEDFINPERDKIVIEDVSSVAEMVEIDEYLQREMMNICSSVRCGEHNIKDFVVYGAGGLLVTKGKERSNASTGFKLSKAGDKDKVKFSDSPGKSSIPGDAVLALDEEGRRVIAQAGEEGTKSLFAPLYRGGEFAPAETLATIRKRVADTMKFVGGGRLGERTRLSDETAASLETLRLHYGKIVNNFLPKS